MPDTISIAKLDDFICLKNKLNEKWSYVMENTTAFRYKLNNQMQKTLDGSLNFVLQVKYLAIELSIKIHLYTILNCFPTF